jgi:hypothetical protein
MGVGCGTEFEIAVVSQQPAVDRQPTSDSVQIVFVVFAKSAFARDAAFPGRDIRHDVRQQAECVKRRNDWQSEHIAKGDGHEEGLERAAQFYRVFLEFVANHSIEEFSGGLNEMVAIQTSSCHCFNDLQIHYIS